MVDRDPSNDMGSANAITQPGPHDAVFAKLVASARQEFLTAGFANTTVAAIASRAGISKKTIYRYSTSKESLLFEVLSAAFEEIFSPIFRSGHQELARDEVARCLVRFCLLSTSKDGIATHRIVITEANRFPEMAHAYKKAIDQYVLGPLAAWIQHQNDNGEIRVDDPKLGADMLGCMIISHFMRDLSLGITLPPSRDEVERVVNTALNIFYFGNTQNMTKTQ